MDVDMQFVLKAENERSASAGECEVRGKVFCLILCETNRHTTILSVADGQESLVRSPCPTSRPPPLCNAIWTRWPGSNRPSPSSARCSTARFADCNWCARIFY